MPDIVANAGGPYPPVLFPGIELVLDGSKSTRPGQDLPLDSASEPGLDYTWTFSENGVAIDVEITKREKTLVPNIKIPQCRDGEMTRFIDITLTITLNGQPYPSPPVKISVFCHPGE